ncbi:MAG: sugar-binding transcriptional regulator [Pseudomonadota bacterium]
MYYVAGNTQDEIARKLGVSRQSAQRLVSLAVSEKLISIRIDHPIARCLELAEQVRDAFGLASCEVVPSDPAAPEATFGLAQAGAAALERYLSSSEPQVVALGTGRALRACVDHIPLMDCSHHKIVSLLGNMMPDGSATAFNVVIRLADRVGAQHYPMPLPVLARSPEELDVLLSQEPVRNILSLCETAQVTFVGIGGAHLGAPLVADGVVTAAEMQSLIAAGAVGEITSWVFDKSGQLIDHPINARVASAPLSKGAATPVIAIAAGDAKVAAIQGALAGRLVTGLITNELTAERLLEG